MEIVHKLTPRMRDAIYNHLARNDERRGDSRNYIVRSNAWTRMISKMRELGIWHEGYDRHELHRRPMILREGPTVDGIRLFMEQDDPIKRSVDVKAGALARIAEITAAQATYDEAVRIDNERRDAIYREAQAARRQLQIVNVRIALAARYGFDPLSDDEIIALALDIVDAMS